VTDAETNPPPIDQRVQTVCLLVIAATAVGMAMYFLRPVLIPFVLAIFFTQLLVPVVDVQVHRLRFPRVVAIGGAAILAALIIMVLAAVVSSTVSQMTASADVYRQRLQQLVSRVAEEVGEELPLERIGLSLGGDGGGPLGLSEQRIGSVVTRIIGAVVNLLSNGMLVLIFTIFMLMGRHAGKPPPGLWAEIEASIRSYIGAMVFVSGLTGILVWVTLGVLGVEFALVFGLLAFLLNFIPNIGSFIATLLPVPVILLNPELSPLAKILAIAIPGAIQFVVGNLLSPKVMGRSLDLHPVVVLLALIFFGVLWGIVGMFLATPLAAAIKIMLEKLELTAPMARLLGGQRP
jgi:AI-2 transport protein TqsA